MSITLKQHRVRSRKASLGIHHQSHNSTQSGLSSPKYNFSSRQLTRPTPMTDREDKKSLEVAERNEMSCQNYFLRKTVLVLYNFFENMKASWNLDQLTYRQMVLVLRELRYIKSGETDRGSEHSQQMRKCYYLWVNLAQKRVVRLTNILVILFHVEHLEIDKTLIEDVIKELSKGISKYQQEETIQGDPTFIFLVKTQGWTFKDGLVQLNPKQIKQVQGQLSSFKYTRLTQSDPKINVEEEEQDNPPLMMSKKSIELASNKREKILKQIKQNRQVQTIELHHILSYKKELGKPAISKIEQCRPEKRLKKSLKLSTGKNNKVIKGKDKENRSRNPQAFKKAKKQNEKPEEHNKQFSEIIGQQLGVSDITKTQIIDDLSFDYVPDEFQSEGQLQHGKSTNELLPHSLVVNSEEKDKKRREYIQLPILYVDVNIEDGKKERIVVYEGDTASRLAADFAQKHGLCEQTMGRLQILLAQQIGSVLSKIDEALEQDCSYLY